MSIAIDLSGKVVLVTGAGGGLGAACAAHFAAAGASVVLTDLDTEALEKVRDRVGTGAVAWPADLRDAASCRRLATRTVEEHARVDALIACAGVMQTKPLLDVTEQDWRRVLDVNLTGTFLLLQAVAKRMLDTGGGAIVLFSSVAGRSGRPLAAHYAASKTALLSLTKSAALAFAPSIRVNAICPGIVPTGMWDQIISDRNKFMGAGAGDSFRRHIETAAPLGRSGDPREIAAAALFLVSDLASYITGQALNVDGGLEMD